MTATKTEKTETQTQTRTFELGGFLVSEAAFNEAVATWPTRPATGYDDRLWGAVIANHVAMVVQRRGEELRRD